MLAVRGGIGVVITLEVNLKVLSRKQQQGYCLKSLGLMMNTSVQICGIWFVNIYCRKLLQNICNKVSDIQSVEI
jgi:hypothetical protein